MTEPVLSCLSCISCLPIFFNIIQYHTVHLFFGHLYGDGKQFETMTQIVLPGSSRGYISNNLSVLTILVCHTLVSKSYVSLMFSLWPITQFGDCIGQQMAIQKLNYVSNHYQ